MDFIPLSSPDLKEDDINAVVKVLQSGMLVQSENVLNFEKSMQGLTGAEHTLAVSNGTATMHLALVILGIGPGDEVIIPALSYIATANVVELVGATPVFVDVDLATFNIDVSKIEARITAKTKAIIPVHEFGLACDISAIMDIAIKHNLYVIEDAACALGATQNDKQVGTFGDFASFSFHPRKAVTSGEGGIIATNNAGYAKSIAILRNHGIDMIDGKMEFVAAGFNYRMTDFQAALVNSQLKRLPQIISYKRELGEVYFNEITNSKVTLPHIPSDRPHTWQTFHLLLDESIDRDQTILKLREQGIGTNYGAQCIPAQIFYRKKYNLDYLKEYPNAYTAFTKGIAIPLYEKLSKIQIKHIAKHINEIG